MALAVVLIIAGAAAAYFVAGGLGGGSKSTTSCTTVSTVSAGGIQTTITLPCGSVSVSDTGGGGGGGSQVSSSTGPSSSSQTTPTTTTSSSKSTYMLETFHGHYTWTSTSNSTGTVETFTASGTFTITIDMSALSGQGSGQGTVDDSLSGSCTGHSMTSYTFDLGGGIDPISGNLTLGFEGANPPTGTTSVTCQGSGTSDHNFGFTSVIPQVVILPAEYGASKQGTSGEVTYEITLA